LLILLFFFQIDSLSLDQVIDRVFENNPDYFQSRISLDKSRVLYTEALCNYLPTLSVSGSYTKHENNGQGAYPYSGSASLSQPILDMDIISSIIDAHYGVKITRCQYESNIGALLLDTRTSYYDLIYAYELVASSEIAIEQAKESYDLIKTKYDIGAASKLDKLQAEVYYLSAQQDKARARTTLSNAQSKLKSLLASENEIYPTDTLVAPHIFEFPPLDSLILAMQKANYSIRIAENTEAQARSDLTFSYLAFLPKISVFYGYSSSLESFTWDHDVWQDNASYNYGVRVSLPIFELKSLIFDNITARQDMKIKEYAKQNTVLEQKLSLQSVYAGLVETYEQLQLADKSLDAATEAIAIAQAQYALGSISFIELLKAEQDIYNAHSTRISSLSDFYGRRAELSYYIGSIVSEEMQ
jgi:outer membrane protein TolC